MTTVLAHHSLVPAVATFIDVARLCVQDTRWVFPFKGRPRSMPGF